MFTALSRLRDSLPQISLSGENEDFAVKMLVGKCRLAIDDSECPCRNGQVISNTGMLDRSTPCKKCQHPISVHDAYTETPPAVPQPGVRQTAPPPPPAPRIRFSDYPQYCPRFETVQKLVTLLERERIVHVRGTPASGKSLLAHFLYGYLLSQNKHVILLNDWPKDKRPLDTVLSACLPEDRRTEAELISSKLTVILDEAQYTYADPVLWYNVIKPVTGIGRPARGVRICTFSSYGSPTTGAPHHDYPESITPPFLSSTQRVSLTLSSDKDSPDICLFYSREEYNDVVERYCRMANEYTMDTGLRDYLFLITNGHPGIITALLDYIYDVGAPPEANVTQLISTTMQFYRSDLKRRQVFDVTLDHTKEALVDDHRLFNVLPNRFSGRSLPSRELLGTDEGAIISALLVVLRNGHAVYDENNFGLNRCFRRGFVHTVLHPITRKSICVFPSPLHARYVEFMYGQRDSAPFPRHKYQEIEDLCKAVVKGFSRRILCQARDGRQLGTSGQIRPLEAAFQDEWYRSFWREVPSGAISSEWSVGGSGRVDFFVIGPGWGVELLRDGSRLDEHCAHFKKGGAYYAAINSGTMQNWMVLDCRHTYPQTTRPTERRLWRIVFKDDYTRVHILDCENKHVAEFVLGNW